jgi:2,4-diaminopentanoate dehydrogenase
VSRFRVIQWGTGAVGLESLKFVLGSRDLDLVGVRCYTQEKDGLDAGELAGGPAIGIRLTRDVSALLELAADCVLFMPRDSFLDPTAPGGEQVPWLEEVLPILESGKNVVSPIQSPMHWRQLVDGASLRRRLQQACERGGSTLFFTGLDPGFVSDCLSITMASAVGTITQIRTWEVIDYATYGAPSTLEAMGFGRRPDELDAAATESLVPSWGCALWLVADSLGVELDDIVLATDSFVSPQDHTSPGGTHVAAGTVGALRWSLTGVVGGEPRVVANHVQRLGAQMAPDWAQIGDRGGYRVEIDGSPPLRGDFPLGLEGGTGTCLGDALVMTAARCVNAVATVVAAPTGYQLLNDLRIFGGRHSLVR